MLKFDTVHVSPLVANSIKNMGTASGYSIFGTIRVVESELLPYNRVLLVSRDKVVGVINLGDNDGRI
jgi:hypothetical protein